MVLAKDNTMKIAANCVCFANNAPLALLVSRLASAAASNETRTNRTTAILCMAKNVARIAARGSGSNRSSNGISQIKRSAKYVDPPPKPTLEYKIAVIKNNIDNIIIIKFFYESKYCTIDCNRY